MKAKLICLLLCILGAAVPYSQFVPWLVEHGLNARLFWQQLFATRISTFFALDVIVSAVVLLRFVRVESSRLRIRRSGSRFLQPCLWVFRWAFPYAFI
jgi:hypothetical protein